MVEDLVVGIELVPLRQEWDLGDRFEVAGSGVEAQRFLGVLNGVIDVFVTVLEPYRICSLYIIGFTGTMSVQHWQTKDRAITAHGSAWHLCVCRLYAYYESYHTFCGCSCSV